MSEAESEGATGREIWIEKYRPETLDDVHGQDDIVDRLRSYIAQDDLPHLLFSGPAGVGKCVTGETPVLTNRGVERIGDVVGEGDGFEDPDAGLEVLTFRDDGSFEFTTPSHVFGKTTDDLVRVTTRDGNDLTVTPEHRLLTVAHDGLEWVRAGNLTAGTRVVRPRRMPLPEGDGHLDWVEAMDGDRTLVHVTEAFAADHDIPVEENYVGKKKRVVAGLRRGESVATIADAAGTTKKTVRSYRRTLDTALDEPSTVCSLSYLRSLDVPREKLRTHVTAVQYVNRNNRRSDPITPPWELTPTLASFVGLAVSEARIDGGRVKFYNTDDGLLDRFGTAAESVFGLEPQRGRQDDVPYRELHTRTLTHFLESCFDVVDGTAGIGSTLVRADEASRAAFLRAVFDAEAHVTEHGIVELTQKDERLVTLLSYLLSGFGIPSRRKRERKAPTNGSGTERAYHTLYVSSARHLDRFADCVGFSIDEKADRLEANAARDPNPNDDTVPTQAAVDTLCERLYLTKRDYVPDSPNPESPGRERYLDGVDTLVDAATARLDDAQRTLERVDELAADLDAVAAIPATWVGTRGELEPIETRRTLAEQVGVRSDRLLEYADGRRTPGSDRTVELLDQLHEDGVDVDVEHVRTTLRNAIETLDVPYAHIADGTDMHGTDVQSLLDGGNDLGSLTRFRTIADRVRSIASGLPSAAVLDALATLHTLTSGDLYFDAVESVDSVDEPRRVYDLTVPGTRNYVAGGVPSVMHNTTCATAIAREIYGDDWRGNFLELNASDQRGIDVVRDRIKNFARSSFGGFDYRIIFLDEADSLCVPPGTEVVTGYPSSPEVKPIEEVSEDGEPIPSVDFETNEIQSDKGKLVDSGVADFFELELEDGRTILASLTHPFFVVDEDGRLVEKELRDLSPGDEIADFKDDIGVSQCEICDAWTAGRFCSVDCKDEGHSRDMRGEHHEREEFEPAVLSDGGLRAVRTAEISRIDYSHRGEAYNISMEGTPDFMLANGILTHNTSDAQSALRRTMEQFADNTRFILSCNYSSRIIDPIQSRCAVFRFSPLPDDAIAAQVREIAAAEGIEMTDDGLDALVYAAGGDMRRAINTLQAAATTGEVVDDEAVYTVTSTARPEEIESMVEAAIAGDFPRARSTLETLLVDSGMAGGDVIDQLHRSAWEFDLDERRTVQLMERLGEADYRITEGANERVQLEAMLAALALDDQDG